MENRVYIGHGTRIGNAYGIELSMTMNLGISGNLKQEIFYLAKYNRDVGRELRPESAFVVVEDGANKLRGHVCGNSRNEKYDTDKTQVLEAPAYASLREYLAAANGDRVVATNDSLADRVEDIVRSMGYETVHFD